MAIWLVLCVVVGVIASNKGRSGIGLFFLALFLSPVVGIIVALVMSENTAKVEKAKVATVATGDNRKCPFCAEVVKSEALLCRYCGKDLPAANTEW